MRARFSEVSVRFGVFASVVAVVLAVVVGCGGSSKSGGSSTTGSASTTSASGTASSSAAPSSSAAQQTPAAGPVLDVTIAKGQVTPTNATLQAKVGQPITVHVTSDATDELHVHSSPDKEFEIAAAPNQTFTFTVNVPGSVDVELHHLDKTVVTIQVQP